MTAIAKQFGLTPDLRLAEGSDPQIGNLFGDSNDTVLTSAPQSLWGFINRLARASGNTVYTTPQKALVFGVPGAGLEPIAITYRSNPIPPGMYGAISLDVEHNPRRNLTFRVLVLSYDPTTSTTTKGQAFVIGSNYSTSEGSTVHAGAWGGTDADNIANAIGTGKGSKKNAVQLYTFHLDGLTAAQAQAQAKSIAADIAKRELIASVKTTCVPTVQPSNPATLGGQINGEFAAHKYFVTQYNHKFSMGKEGGGEGAFDTHMMMLDEQPTGTGESVTAGGGE